jgi:acetoacetyl-CoA reductase/3-oxoacyl-[acyl-carrier protein] reductase
MAVLGEVAAITGAGMGIGRAAAVRLARDGAKVALLDRDVAAMDEVAEEIARSGGTAVCVAVDMLDAQAIAGAFARVARDLGPVDVLVNNVGQSARERARPFWEGDPDLWDFTLDICLRSAMVSTRQVVAGMRARGSGRIVNMSSEAAFLATDIIVDYAAAKAGLIGFTRALARSLAPSGITVNAICPGLVRTRVMDQLPEETVRRAVAGIPIGFIADPEDIAAIVSFLASEGSRYITGQSLLANGGKWMI